MINVSVETPTRNDSTRYMMVEKKSHIQVFIETHHMNRKKIIDILYLRLFI